MNCDKCGEEIVQGSIVDGRPYCLPCALTPEVLAAAQAALFRNIQGRSG